jgi:hypothetical protein
MAVTALRDHLVEGRHVDMTITPLEAWGWWKKQ